MDCHLHVYSKDTSAFPWANPKGAVPPEPSGVEDYLDIAGRAGITKAVLVQPSAYALDSSYMRAVVDRYPDRFRFMVIADYRNENGPRGLEKEMEDPRMCGGRLNLIADERTPEVLGKDPSVLRTVEVLAEKKKVVGLHIRQDQFGLAEAIAARFPQGRFVVDHLGYPEPAETVPSSYAKTIDRLAGIGNVYFKLSGYEMKSKAGYPFKDMTAFAACLLEKAGSKRCLWASNYPFVGLASKVEQVLGLVDGLTAGDGEVESDILFRTGESLFWKGSR
jgi:predicted TIM-barrel fold metal-dependent hydrolase